LGFDAAWYSNFYHHLVGAGNEGPQYARLLEIAGYGDDRPLGMDKFADCLTGSRNRCVVYHESHDEAGNAEHTARLIVVAANRAPLEGDTRRYAEARCRLVAGMALLAPATPMFFMGEEVGATEPFRYNDFLNHRQDLASLRADGGGRLFHFYQDLIRLRLATPALKSTGIDILNVHDGNRVLAFLRRSGAGQFVVLASLNNRPFTSGYRIGSPALPDGDWLEMFNSDSVVYGGDNVGNGGGVLHSGGGGLEAVVPANGFVILERV
jgi:1,4-alpha-glucan branching enzyme